MSLGIFEKCKPKGHKAFEDPLTVSEENLIDHMLRLHLNPRVRCENVPMARYDLEVAAYRGFECMAYSQALAMGIVYSNAHLEKVAKEFEVEYWTPASARASFALELEFMNGLGMIDVDWNALMSYVPHYEPGMLTEKELDKLCGVHESFFNRIGDAL